MELINKMQIGNTTIEAYSSDITLDQQKENLKDLYKVINEIAEEKRQQGKNVDDWFYSKEQLKYMKESGKYNFL